ncbi:MAG: YjiH family protein [Clostridia bacterium]|nr:YjiH family protein [Clostridia bacterium]
MNSNNKKKYTISQYMKFILPSLLGILLFITPIYWGGKWTIGVGILAEFVKKNLNDYLAPFMILMFCLSIIITILAKLSQPAFIENNDSMKKLFDVGMFWIIIRMAGTILAILTFLEIGPEFIWSGNTGGVALGLVKVLSTWFFFSAFFIPLLLDFGIMDLVGTLIRGIMKPLFTLPGRSTLDCMASWIGSGTVGVVITTMQYDEGYYTQREACVIATCFSIVSIAFCLVVTDVIGMGHMFIQIYLTVSIVSIIAAILIPRIPPLSRKPDTYYEPVGKQINEVVPEGKTKFQWGLEKALEKANTDNSMGQVVKKGFDTVVDIWFGLCPVVMTLATAALIIAEYTPIFNIISYPIIPILNLLQIPEAAAAAPTIIVGFADMFLPAVIGQSITSELTRFIIVSLSVTQLVFMTETGPVIFRSNLKINFVELFIVFIERTIITLPIIVLIAHLFFF